VASARTDGQARTARDPALSGAQQKDNPTFDAALDFNCDYMDEPNLQLQKFLSHDKSAINYAGRPTACSMTFTTNSQANSTRRSASRCYAKFERRALDQAYTIPTIWWHRIIVLNKQLKGWHITPSHYVGQDLADVWLDK